jgi:hypothetical protein
MPFWSAMDSLGYREEVEKICLCVFVPYLACLFIVIEME